MRIGVVLPLTAAGESVPMPRYREIRDVALRAEADGFDSIWVYDHLLFRFPETPPVGIWESWTILSALAEATERVELGTLVMCVPFRNPGLLAKMADALDEVSGGRLILGLGAGWHQPEFDAFGYPMDKLATRFEEAVEIIAPMLREGAATFDGTFYRADDALSLPRGPRPSGPPILIGAFGPRMLRLTAKWADAWNTCWMGRPTDLPERLDALRRACEEVGRNPDDIRKTVGVNVALPDLGPVMPGSDNPEKALAGTPEEIAADLRAYEALGVDDVILSADPNSAEAYRRLGEIVRAYRAS